MGCFIGIEVSELVDSYILRQLSQLCEHHPGGLNSNDDLGVLKSLSGPESERVKKKVIRYLWIMDLKITIKADLHVVNLLDVTLDLHNNAYESHRKPDNHLVYNNKNFNHQKTI